MREANGRKRDSGPTKVNIAFDNGPWNYGLHRWVRKHSWSKRSIRPARLSPIARTGMARALCAMSLNQFQCNRFSGPEDNAQKSAIHEFSVRPILRRDVVFGLRSRVVELCESGLCGRQEGCGPAAVGNRPS